MLTVAQLQIELNANTKPGEEALKRTSQEAEKTGQQIEKTGGLFSGLPKFIGGAISGLMNFASQLSMITMGLGQIIPLFSGWIGSAEDAAANQAQLNAVLQSTHFAAGMTADQINQMVQKLKDLNGVDDDVILSGENMLLTFTNIGGSVLPEATQAMMDMAVKMNNGSLAGLDLKDTAIQLGKALNDPINGITALSRVGVTFTDQQKAQIKAMMDAGDVAGAQKIILSELEREFGGSAKAAGDVDPFNRFKLAMGDIGKAIGGILLPPLTSLANFITPLANDFLNWIGTLNQTGGIFSQLGDIWNKDILPELQEIGRIITVDAAPGFNAIKDAVNNLIAPFQNLHVQMVPLQQIWNQINNVVWQLTQGFNLIASVLSGQVSQSFNSTMKDWGPIIQQVAGWFQTTMLPALQSIEPPLENLVGIIITDGIPAFFAVRDAISHIAAVVVSTVLPVFEKWWPILAKVVGYVVDLAGKALKELLPKVQEAAQEVGKFADGLSQRLQPFIQHVTEAIQIGSEIIGKLWNQLWPTISSVVKLAWDNIQSYIKIAWDIIKGIFNIGADILSGNWGQLWKDVQDMASNIWNDIKGAFNTFWSDIGNVVGNVWSGVLLPFFQGLWNSITGWFGNLIDGLKKAWNDFWNGLGGGGTSHLPSGYGHPGSGARASGGPVFGGAAYTVGEAGRELFVPMQPGFIVPHQQTEALLAGGGGGGHNYDYSITLNGPTSDQMMQQLRAGQARQKALVFGGRR